MTRRSIRGSASLLCVAVLASCAAPPATDPPSAPATGGLVGRAAGGTSPAEPSAAEASRGLEVEAAEEGPAYVSLLRESPELAAATAALDAALSSHRPAALMRRAREALSGAQRARSARGGPFGFSWLVEREVFLAYCDLALRDLAELLAGHPQAPEAAEAQFTVAQINDYPNLNLFDEAREGYRLTIERFPRTPWAARARERMVEIEGITGGVKGGPHAAPAP